MAEKRAPIVTIEEVTYRHYKVLSVYFTNSKTKGSAFHNYTPRVMTGNEVFEYVENLAKNNGYVLERNTEFECDAPRMLVQDVKDPGIFRVPYSL